jgi:hypothetical protein
LRGVDLVPLEEVLLNFVEGLLVVAQFEVTQSGALLKSARIGVLPHRVLAI